MKATKNRYSKNLVYPNSKTIIITEDFFVKNVLYFFIFKRFIYIKIKPVAFAMSIFFSFFTLIQLPSVNYKFHWL